MNLISQRLAKAAMGAIGISAVVGSIGSNGASAVTITYEAPNVVVANTAVIGSNVVNTFEAGTVSTTPVASTFNFQDATTTNNYRANYDKLVVANYGSSTQTAGAGYTGKFVVNSNRTDLTNPALPTTNLTFTDTTQGGISTGIKYFGIFYSSLDSDTILDFGFWILDYEMLALSLFQNLICRFFNLNWYENQLTFYNGSTELAKVSISNFGTLVGNATPFVGGPFAQPGAFFNFYAGANEQFTRIEFTQNGTEGGFENDNHTFRIPDALAISGSGVNLAGLSFTGNVTSTPVPEPLTIIGSVIGGTAAVGMRKKLRSTRER